MEPFEISNRRASLTQTSGRTWFCIATITVSAVAALIVLLAKMHTPVIQDDSCLEDRAYHSGTMVNDNAVAGNATECSMRCTGDPRCLFWDFQRVTSFGIGGVCRLRANSGSGAELAVNFQGGPRDCALKICISSRLYSPSREEREIIASLFEPLVPDEMGKGFDVQNNSKRYNALVPKAIWKVHPENTPLVTYKARRDYLNAVHNKSYWIRSGRDDVQKRARLANLTEGNEYLLLRGESTIEKFFARLCEGYKLPASDFPKTWLKNIFGHGRYFCDASDKADQYSLSVPNLSILADLVSAEDEQLHALRKPNNELFLMSVSRVYLGHHGEVAFMALDCWQRVDRANQSKMWYYRDGDTQKDYNVYDRPDDRFNTTPPFGKWELPEWDSIKVMSQTFEPDFSSDWTPDLPITPARYNEYIIPDEEHAAMQYVIVYERHWEEREPSARKRRSRLDACANGFQLPEYIGRNNSPMKSVQKRSSDMFLLWSSRSPRVIPALRAPLGVHF